MTKCYVKYFLYTNLRKILERENNENIGLNKMVYQFKSKKKFLKYNITEKVVKKSYYLK